MRADEMTLVLLDSSESAYPEGPYVADAYKVEHGDIVSEESRGCILAEKVMEGHWDRLGEVLICGQEFGVSWVVPLGDVAEVLTLAEVRDRLLGVDQ